MRRDELVLIGYIKQSVPHFTSGSCNHGNNSVIIFSFTTTQNKIFFFKALTRGSPYILFQPLHLHYLGKFYTGLSLPCNP